MPGFDQLVGAAAIAGGILGFLYGNGNLPREERDPGAWVRWRAAFGRHFRIVGPLLAAYGLVRFLGFLSPHHFE